MVPSAKDAPCDCADDTAPDAAGRSPVVPEPPKAPPRLLDDAKKAAADEAGSGHAVPAPSASRGGNNRTGPALMNVK